MYQKLKKYLKQLYLNFVAKKDGKVFYVGGSDTLPPPLNKEDEQWWTSRLGNPDYSDKARQILIEHNLRLVVYIAKRFDSTGIGIEDLISIGTIGLIKAINTFKPEKNIKLATYASRCIENEILMYLRKNNKIRYEISLDEPLNIDYDGNELLLGDIVGTDDDLVEQEMMKSDQRKLFYEALKDLNEREKEILILRYGLSNHDELTQKDVAKLLGISQSYISRLEKKIIKKLRNQLNFDEVKE